MKEMKIEYKNIEELIPYENNPRINKEAVDYVANSIKEFGFKNPIIIDKNNIIVAGHTRLKACEKLGIKRVPTITADDLTDEQIKAFRIADNKVAEFSKWDTDKLNIELDNIDIDMSEFGFEDLEMEDIDISNNDEEEKYTTKVDVPQYQITGEEPDISELVDCKKAEELIEEIKNSKVSEEQKEFLIKSATRHYAFNYSKIAEYYAHQDKEMQELMEKSALVIIDFDDAIKNGFAELKNRIDEIEEEDEAENYD